MKASNKIAYSICLIGIFIVCCIFSSCNTSKHSSLSFEKRKYSKGHFFDHIASPPKKSESGSIEIHDHRTVQITDKTIPQEPNMKYTSVKENYAIMPSKVLFTSIQKKESAIGNKNFTQYSTSYFHFSKITHAENITPISDLSEVKHNNGIKGFIYTILFVATAIVILAISISPNISEDDVQLLIPLLFLIALILFIVGLIFNIEGLTMDDRHRKLALVGGIIDSVVVLGLLIALMVK